jgi:NADPH-dependent FMN reductase
MNASLTILGIAGRLREASCNRAVLRAAEQLAPKDAPIEIFELDGIPPYNQDDEMQPPERVVQLKAKIRAAAAILFVTPENEESAFQAGGICRDYLNSGRICLNCSTPDSRSISKTADSTVVMTAPQSRNRSMATV